MSIGRNGRDDQNKAQGRKDSETIETQYICPHLWFFPNDEICKGMFDLLHIRPYNLFLRSAYHSVPRKEKTLVSVGGGECRDLLKNRCSGIDYRRKKRMTTYYGLDGGLSS